MFSPVIRHLHHWPLYGLKDYVECPGVAETLVLHKHPLALLAKLCKRFIRPRLPVYAPALLPYAALLVADRARLRRVPLLEYLRGHRSVLRQHYPDSDLRSLI